MNLDAVLDDIEVDIGLSQVDIKSNKITTSTGLLSLDLMLSGGMVTGGWYTMFGGEQSCKSTLVMTQKRHFVLDPFCGSGTTGVACKKLSRNFIGIEKEEKYYKIAKDRLENSKNSVKRPTLFKQS